MTEVGGLAGSLVYKISTICAFCAKPISTGSNAWSEERVEKAPRGRTPGRCRGHHLPDDPGAIDVRMTRVADLKASIIGGGTVSSHELPRESPPPVCPKNSVAFQRFGPLVQQRLLDLLATTRAVKA